MKTKSRLYKLVSELNKQASEMEQEEFLNMLYDKLLAEEARRAKITDELLGNILAKGWLK